VRRDVAFEGLGQHMQQRRSEQHTGRQAHQMSDDQAQQGCRHGSRQADRNHAAEEGGSDDVKQGHQPILANLSTPARPCAEAVT